MYELKMGEKRRSVDDANSQRRARRLIERREIEVEKGRIVDDCHSH